MSPAQLSATFRLHAARCIEIAKELPNPHLKAAALNMAQTWFALADQVERHSGIVHGVSLIPSAADEP